MGQYREVVLLHMVHWIFCIAATLRAVTVSSVVARAGGGRHTRKSHLMSERRLLWFCVVGDNHDVNLLKMRGRSIT